MDGKSGKKILRSEDFQGALIENWYGESRQWSKLEGSEGAVTSSHNEQTLREGHPGGNPRDYFEMSMGEKKIESKEWKRRERWMKLGKVIRIVDWYRRR